MNEERIAELRKLVPERDSGDDFSELGMALKEALDALERFECELCGGSIIDPNPPKGQG